MILADENIASAVVARLRGDGLDVLWIERSEILSALFKELGSEVIDAFTVVDGDGRIRIRRAGGR